MSPITKTAIITNAQASPFLDVGGFDACTGYKQHCTKGVQNHEI